MWLLTEYVTKGDRGRAFVFVIGEAMFHNS